MQLALLCFSTVKRLLTARCCSLQMANSIAFQAKSRIYFSAFFVRQPPPLTTYNNYHYSLSQTIKNRNDIPSCDKFSKICIYLPIYYHRRRGNGDANNQDFVLGVWNRPEPPLLQSKIHGLHQSINHTSVGNLTQHNDSQW
jgi:hypothetical protein